MNRTQKAIIVSWVILTAIAVCVLSKITIFLPYGLILFLFVRGRVVDEEAAIKQYFHDYNRVTVSLMVFSVAPWVWYLYRLLSTTSLTDTLGRKLLLVSIPFLSIMVIFDRWLYHRSM